MMINNEIVAGVQMDIIGIEIINVGPGDSREGHAVNESILIDELLDAAVIHLDAVDRLLDIQT